MTTTPDPVVPVGDPDDVPELPDEPNPDTEPTIEPSSPSVPRTNGVVAGDAASI